MARDRAGYEKRRREQDRRTQADAKRAARLERKQSKRDGDDEAPSEDDLLESVRKLHEERAEGTVDDETFETRLAELHEALGLA